MRENTYQIEVGDYERRTLIGILAECRKRMSETGNTDRGCQQPVGKGAGRTTEKEERERQG